MTGSRSGRWLASVELMFSTGCRTVVAAVCELEGRRERSEGREGGIRKAGAVETCGRVYIRKVGWPRRCTISKLRPGQAGQGARGSCHKSKSKSSSCSLPLLLLSLSLSLAHTLSSTLFYPLQLCLDSLTCLPTQFLMSHTSLLHLCFLLSLPLPSRESLSLLPFLLPCNSILGILSFDL